MKIKLSFEFGERGVQYESEASIMDKLDDAEFAWIQGHLNDLAKTFYVVSAKVFASLDETIHEVNDDL